MKKILDSDWLRGVQFYRNTVRKKKHSAKKEIFFKRKNKKHFDFYMLKTLIELLCHSNDRVNYLFRMCFVPGSEHEFASV